MERLRARENMHLRIASMVGGVALAACSPNIAESYTCDFVEEKVEENGNLEGMVTNRDDGLRHEEAVAITMDANDIKDPRNIQPSQPIKIPRNCSPANK